MKYVSLIRHAKSSWKFPELKDRDRPLNRRGQRDLPRMAKRYARTWSPERLISSPAVRALTTAVGFAEPLRIDTQAICIDERVYHASPLNLVERIGSQEDRFQHIALFGHNPGFTELCNLLSDASIENIPTCGIAVIALPISRWRDLLDAKKGPPKGELLLFDYPKKMATS